MYRQGDILIVREDGHVNLDDLYLLERDSGRIVLAYGEVTGHAHAIHSKEANLYQQKGTSSIYLIVDNTVNLSHEEHSAIPIPKGKYKVIRQVEYIPFDIRVVAD